MTGQRLDPADAIELAELLQLLTDWIGADHATLDNSLTRFTGHPTYGATALRQDLNRFTFLLGANDGEHLFGHDQP
jgi:hypothetical protein